MKIKQIYVINLKRRKDKLKRIMKRINNIDPDGNINVEIFTAIDGLKIDEQFMKDNNISILKEWIDPFKKTKINKGEIGCALSHYKIWEDIIENNYNSALILEDDAEFIKPNVFMNKIDEIDEPNNTDLLYFGRKKFKEDEDYIENHNNIVKPFYSYWTIGYYITYSGALKLLKSNFSKKLIPVDEFLPLMYGISHPSAVANYSKYYDINLLNAYSIDPLLIKPEDNAFQESEIEDSKPFQYSTILYKDLQLKVVIKLKNINEVETDLYLRFKDSITKFNIKCIELIGTKDILSIKEKVKSHDILINIDYKSSIFTIGEEEILDKYLELVKEDKTKIILSQNKNTYIGTFSSIEKYLTNTDKNNSDIEIIDNNNNIFHPINNNLNEYSIDIKKTRLVHKTGKIPSIIMGDIKIPTLRNILDNMSNYIPLKFRGSYGYNTMDDIKEDLTKYKILVKIINKNSDNGKLFNNICDSIEEFNYPQKNIKIIETVSDDLKYDKNYDYLLTINVNNIEFKFKDIIKLLISRNKNIISPYFLIQSNKGNRPNFKMKIDNNFTPDYKNIIEGKQRGCWIVSEIEGIVLYKMNYIKNIKKFNEYEIFKYVDNTNLYGVINEVL